MVFKNSLCNNLDHICAIQPLPLHIVQVPTPSQSKPNPSPPNPPLFARPQPTPTQAPSLESLSKEKSRIKQTNMNCLSLHKQPLGA